MGLDNNGDEEANDENARYALAFGSIFLVWVTYLFTMRKNINNVNLNSTMIGGLRLSHLSLYFCL